MSDSKRTLRSLLFGRLAWLLLAVLFACCFSRPSLALQGELDPTFGVGGKVFLDFVPNNNDYVFAMALQSDGKIVAGIASTDGDFGVARYNTNGSLDNTFSGDGVQILSIGAGTSYVNSIKIDGNGKIVATGSSQILDTPTAHLKDVITVVRYNSNGTLDTTFSGDGIVTQELGTQSWGNSVAIDANGKIVIASLLNQITGGDFAVLRYNTNGSLDTTFGSDGIVVTDLGGIGDTANSVAINENGKIIVAGTVWPSALFVQDIAVVRYLSDGTLDTSFSSDGIQITNLSAGNYDEANSVVVDNQGKITVAGSAAVNGYPTFAIIRYNANGTLDTSFSGDGIRSLDIGDTESRAYSLALDSQNRIAVAGYAKINGVYTFTVARLNIDASLDTSFGGGIHTTAFLLDTHRAHAVVVDNTDRIIAGGFTSSVGVLVRYQSLYPNEPPNIDFIANKTTNEDIPTTVTTVVGDEETAAANLALSFTSSNTTLLPVANISSATSGGNRTITLTPAANANGSSVVTVKVTDGDGLFTTTSFTLTVNPINDAPTIGAIANKSTNEDTNTTVTAVIDDEETALGNLTLSFTSSNTALLPVANISSTGTTGNRTITLDPATNASGTSVVTVKVTDGGGLTDTASFTLTVNPVNDAPVAVSNSYTTSEDTVLAITPTGSPTGVLANDDDVENNTLTIFDANTTLAGVQPIAAPGHGDLVLNANGGFTYTPDAHFNGTDSFTYRATDGAAISNIATVTITVNPINDAPLITAIANKSTNEDTATTVSAVVSDLETLAANLTLSFASSNTNLLPVANISSATSGGNRTITLTPVANLSGGSVVTITVTDGGGLTDTASFTLTVNPINDAPIISAIANKATNEDTATTVTTVVSDLETATASLTLSFASSNTNLLPVANISSITNGGNRTITLTPAANLNGSSVVTVTVTDGGSLTDTATFTLTVNAINDAPVGSNDSYSTNEDTTLTITPTGTPAGLLANDDDIENGTLTVVDFNGSVAGVQPVTAPTHGDLVLNANGGFTYTPDPDYSGTDSFTYRATDGSAASNNATVTITITAVNDAPTVNAIANKSTNEDTATTVTTVVADKETAAASLTLSFASSNTTLLPVANISSATSGGNRTITLTPEANANGTSVVTVTVTDGGGLTDTASFTLTVNAINDAPIIAAIANKTTNEDTATTVTTVVDDEETTPASLTLSFASSNTNLLPIANISSATSGGNRTITLTPATNLSGSSVVTVTVTDGGSLTDTASFTLTVTAVNDAPVASNDSYSTSEDTVLSITTTGTPAGLLANDDDTENSALSVVDVNGTAAGVQPVTAPTHGDLVLNTNGSFTYTPDPDYSGTDSFTYKVTDGTTNSNAATVTLTVTAVNDAPLISTITNKSTNEDTATTVTAVVSDKETAAASLALSFASSNTTLLPVGNISSATSSGNRTITLTPAANLSGTSVVTVTVTDGGGLTDTASFTLTVNTVNDAPTIAAIANKSTNEDTATTVTTVVDDEETTPASLTLSFASSNTNLLPMANISSVTSGGNRTITLTPVANLSGSSVVTVTVTDGGGLTDTASFTLTVNTVNDAPIISAIANKATNEDTATTVVTVVSDLETPAASLTLSYISSNTALLPIANISSVTSGGNRTITLTPMANMSGSTNVSVTVTDAGGLTDVSSFTLTVNPVNDAPAISDIADQSMTTGTLLNVLFSIGDLETPAANLGLSATSSNLTLVPVANISFGGGGSTRNLYITSAAGQSGSTIITVTVTDANGATATSSFLLTVTNPNPIPTISAVDPLATSVGGSIDIYGNNLGGATSVTIGAGNTPQTFTVVNSNQIHISAVAAGTQSGYVKVTTPGGTATSADQITVSP